MGLKKILFLSELYPPLIGGTCNKFKIRFGLYPSDKVIVLTKAVKNAKDFDQSIKYQIKRVPLEWKGPKGFEWIGIVWGLIREAFSLTWQQKIKIIECARPLPEGLAGYILSKMFLKKLVINIQGEDISVLQNYLVERFLMKRIIRSAHMNIANSSYTEELVKNLGGKKTRTTIVYPGVNIEPLIVPFSPLEVSRLRESFGGTPILLTLARLQLRKGQDNVIRALPDLIKHFPELKYVVVGSSHGGSNDFINDLKELAEQLNISQHVILVGEVKKEEVPIYYKACDLYVMPNRYLPGGDVEGFGQVFLEAGYMGKPVIGGNAGGVPDAIQHEKTGLLVDGNSVEEISKAILKILSDKELAQHMGKRGKEFALSLTGEKVFGKYKKMALLPKYTVVFG